MASEWAQVMAPAILSKASSLRRGSVPNGIDEDAVKEWAECLDLIDAPRVNEMWAEAVRDWAVNEPNDRMFTPYSLKQAVLRARQRWDNDPDRAPVLNEWRYRKRVASLESSGVAPDVVEGMLGQVRQNLNLDDSGKSLARVGRRALG